MQEVSGKLPWQSITRAHRFSQLPFTYQISAVGMCVAEKYVNNWCLRATIQACARGLANSMGNSRTKRRSFSANACREISQLHANVDVSVREDLVAYEKKTRYSHALDRHVEVRGRTIFCKKQRCYKLAPGQYRCNGINQIPRDWIHNRNLFMQSAVHGWVGLRCNEWQRSGKPGDYSER